VLRAAWAGLRPENSREVSRKTAPAVPKMARAVPKLAPAVPEQPQVGRSSTTSPGARSTGGLQRPEHP
jgi:hypothetical protein